MKFIERLKNSVDQNITTFFNRKVTEFDSQTGITDPVGSAYALRWDVCKDKEEDNITNKIQPLLQDIQVNKIEALVFGTWAFFGLFDWDSSLVVNSLVAAKDRLTNLKAVFIGDIIHDEYEISWITQSDISPILQAYPNLEMLQIRGGTGLEFSPLRHNKLEALIVETGGLYRETIAEICALQLPALEHLELWLGSESYEGDSSVEDLRPILRGDLFPNLTYLGLRNSEYSDEIAKAIVNAPVIEKIKVLDLSMGTLSEEGVEVLLNCPAVNWLEILNVSENYLSDDIIDRLKQLNIQVIADNQKSDDGDRYCSIAE